MTPRPQRIGRFEIIRVLGRGGQGEVFLAHDPYLERQVALKTLSLDPTDDDARAELVRLLLAEARIVATLQHPNLVALYDAGEHDGAPYLVFEYVPGNTLAERLRAEHPLPAAQAAAIALGSLRGVAYAHAQGVLHRDLKPGNIMLAPTDLPRVTDFGIACRSPGRAPGHAPLLGSPSYAAPECLADGTYLPASDVYALGCVLYEMLVGEPPARSATAAETLARAARGDFPPPSHANPQLDGRLDAVVMKALASDPAARYATAAEMAQALDTYLAPEAPLSAKGARGTLEFLLRRMRHQSDFPVLSDTISAINRIAGSEGQPASAMCNAILKDQALTGKLLKLVNAAHYREFGDGIGTVSHAISVLGFDGVRNVATSLLLFEHLRDRAQAGALAEELVASYFSALLARELVQRIGVRNAEEAFICAMFHRLGRLLVRFYLREEHAAIERLAQSRGWEEARAADDILGMSYAALGMGVARSWNFPQRIVDSMRPLEAPVASRRALQEDRLRVLAALSSALCEAARCEAPQERAARVRSLASQYGKATGLSERVLEATLRASFDALAREVPCLGLPEGGALLRQVHASGAEPNEACAPFAEKTIVLAPQAAQADGERHQSTNAPERHAVLAAGVQEITDVLLERYDLNDVLRMVLETMYRGIGFRRVLLCVRDAHHSALRARFGFGSDADAIVRSGFSVPLDSASDVFARAARDGADVCIEDLEDPAVRNEIPAWYRRAVSARGMALFPLRANGKTVAIIYADAEEPAMLRFRPEELNLLKSLRNQAVLAIRQSG